MKLSSSINRSSIFDETIYEFAEGAACNEADSLRAGHKIDDASSFADEAGNARRESGRLCGSVIY